MSKQGNTSGYEFHPKTPIHEISGYFPGREGLLIWEDKKIQGIAPFGPQGGVITEDKLTPAIVDFLMSKEIDGEKQYAHLLVKVGGKKTQVDVNNPGGDDLKKDASKSKLTVAPDAGKAEAVTLSATEKATLTRAKAKQAEGKALTAKEAEVLAKVAISETAWAEKSTPEGDDENDNSNEGGDEGFL